ncbi:MAG TPA: hypothetical protein VF771_17980, partial [Longimicrobiaceae bacterium]
LGDTPGPDPSVIQLTYGGARPAGVTAARLHDMVNNNFPAPIVIQNVVITAMSAGIDPYSGLDVTGNGLTYIDTTVSPSVVRVVYDITLCLNAGLFGFDVDGNRITTPRPVLLYHELSHAFRRVTNTRQPNDEPPAETDENDMRTALGLCLRDVNNHDGGCGGGDDCGGGTGGCFIVSAATGSSESAEVVRLRRLRDRVAGASGLCARLIDAVYREYARFSPAIATELGSDPMARQAVLWIVVRPLFAWYSLAETLGFEARDPKAVRRAAKEVGNACPRHLEGFGIGPLLERFRTGEALPASAPRLLREFEPRLRRAARLPFASWAILDPLVRAWTAAARGADPVDEVLAWLAAAPVEELAPPPGGPTAVAREISELERLLEFQPSLFHQTRKRLAAAWPNVDRPHGKEGF